MSEKKKQQVHEYSSTKHFLMAIMRHFGNGYIYIQQSHIPADKIDKLAHIDTKVLKRYEANLPLPQRQYRKRKGKANFAVMRYGLYCMVVMKTDGEDTTCQKFEPALGAKIKFNQLEVQLVRDQQKKEANKSAYTFILTKKFYKDLSIKFETYIEKRDSSRFKQEMTKLYNLHRAVRYRGVQTQIGTLLMHIRRLQKKHGTNYPIPQFFTERVKY